MAPELKRRPQRIAIHDIRFNGDRCPTQLIEQCPRSWMIRRVALLQRENGCLVGLLPCEKRPVFVHGSKVVRTPSTPSQLLLTASYISLLPSPAYRTSPISRLSNISHLPSPEGVREPCQ